MKGPVWKWVIGVSGTLLALAVLFILGPKLALSPNHVNRHTESSGERKPSLTLGFFTTESGHSQSEVGRPAQTRDTSPETSIDLPVPSTGQDRKEGDEQGVRSMPMAPLVWPTGIGPDDLPPWMHDRPEDYLEKIDEVRDETPSPERSQENNTVQFMGAQPDPVTGYPYSDIFFDPSVTRLYAWFPCDSPVFNGRTKILTKWFYEDSSELLFEGMSILDTTPYNYVWREEPFWSPGTYSVEIYGLEEDVPLLAWGSYQIMELDDYSGFAGLYTHPDEYQSRQSFPIGGEIYLKVNYSSSVQRQVQILALRVPDGVVVHAGVVTVPEDNDGDYIISLTEPQNPFEPGIYLLELYNYPEPRYLVNRNVFTVLE